jgi:thiamine pyrophosphokinase
VRTFIVAGSPGGEPPQGLTPQPDDMVIAADAGARHARAWGWPIHLLIGDLDSLDASEAQRLREAGVPVVTAPTAKDETDLELALERALATDAGSIVITGALGGRTDHLLANVLLLARPDLAGRDVIIADGPEEVRLLRGDEDDGAPATIALHGAAGDLLSLLPLGGAAEGVTTTGLQYPLVDETLYVGRGRGISNVFLGTVARVMLRTGQLLVIHTQQGGESG